MFKKLIAACAFVMSLSATPLYAQDLTPSGWWVDGISNDRNNSYALMVFRAVDNNGRVAICGGVFNGGVQNRRLREVISNYLISLDGTPILRNINGFSSVANEEDLGKEYSCIDTQTPWFEGANERLETRLTRRRY